MAAITNCHHSAYLCLLVVCLPTLRDGRALFPGTALSPRAHRRACHLGVAQKIVAELRNSQESSRSSIWKVFPLLSVSLPSQISTANQFTEAGMEWNAWMGLK